MRPGPSRFRIFFFLTLLVVLALCAQLLNLQVWQRNTLAQERRANILGAEFLAAPRGRILAKNDVVLAEDQMRFEVAIHYRYFRRDHPMALLLHFDGLVNWIRTEEGQSNLALRYPEATQLRYQDNLSRFEDALDRWLALPCSKLRRKGIRLQEALASLRFYTFRLLSQTVRGSQVGRYGKDYKISTRFNSWHTEQDHHSILKRFAPALTGLEGARAESELRARLVGLLQEGHRNLVYLDERLALEQIPPKATVFERLDYWYSFHGQALQAWLVDLAEKRALRALEKQQEPIGAWLHRLFLGEERLVVPDLEAKLDRIYEIENYPKPMFPGISVSFDRIVALIAGRPARYPGFRIQERYGRIYPSGTDETRLSMGPYPERLLKGLVPKVIGTVRTHWIDDDDNKDNKDNQQKKPAPTLTENPYQMDLEEHAFRRYTEELADYAWEKGRLAKRTGISGLEKSMDRFLRGVKGLRSTVSDRQGVERGMPNINEAVPGRDVQVTLDWRLQTLGEQHLELMAKELGFGPYDAESDHHGSAALVMIDAEKGDILCMAGFPRAIELELEGKPAWIPISRNVCVDVPARHGYLGSTIKPFMAIEAMIRFPNPLLLVEECQGRNGRSGSQGRHYYQNRSFKVSCNQHVWRGYELHCSQGIENAIQESCNAFFCQLGRLMGREGLEAGLGRFGLHSAESERSKTTDPGLRVLKPGYAGSGWALNRMGIGYGIVAAPVQVARAYAGLGTGRLPDLRLVESINGVVQDHGGEELGIDDRILSRVRTGMARVVALGSAKGHEWLSRTHTAGKTGTAIVWVRVQTKGPDLVKRYRSWFSGYYPRENPTIAFSCVYFGAKEGGGKMAARTLDSFFQRLDADARLRNYLPEFARSRRVR